LVGLLALSISPIGWLHANGKPVIIGPLCHTKPYTVAQLDTELYFNFSLVSSTEFGRNGRNAILQLIEDRLQQVVATIW
jgi:hypothetical protein